MLSTVLGSVLSDPGLHAVGPLGRHAAGGRGCHAAKRLPWVAAHNCAEQHAGPLYDGDCVSAAAGSLNLARVRNYPI